MTVQLVANLVGLAVAVVLTGYLIVALLFPEKF
ncbi:K(+)-transporting ATPase subunit F [Fodinicola acaciae]|nr:K(+)-transporting ATPase subunit F [Fodinicola acaciae]